ncbi:MAG TPA: O-methyltransferase [Terracidiphilus sp.]|jgi:predicted O-methyltransferase YrrM|nr:O-methyltransferase [Terracidiphilus sp.]HUX28098.1 O-methyltransferase [Terracidiphilus sp.]
MERRKSGQPLWTAVDKYLGDLLAPSDPILEDALEANCKAGLPAIDVSPLQGKFLHVLVQMTQAKRVLEIGLLGGYSTIWMARALPRGGRIVSLEFSPKHADVARANLKRAGLLKRVDVRVGPALDSLPVLAAERGGKFDLIFIDADKPNNPRYLEWALKLARRGTVIVVDNIVRQGRVIEADSKDADILETRRCLEMMAANPRLSAFAMQTAGVKGLDGFAMAVVSR